MSLKQLLIIVASATAICWLSCAMVLFEVDPLTSGWVGLLIFYLSLFFALLGSFFMIVFLTRKYLIKKTELEYRIVNSSLRQSFFFALIIIGALFLQSKRFLTWWNIIILIVAIGALEYLFLSFRRPTPAKSDNNPPEGYIPPDF